MRLLYGVFAWTTSASVLARFARDLAACGGVASNRPDLSKLVANSEQARVGKGTAVAEQKSLILEEFSFEVTEQEEADKLAAYIQNALPDPKTSPE